MAGKERHRMSGGIPFGELLAIFQPGLEHVTEERERREKDLVVPGDADSDWDVDLETGSATLRRP